MRGRVAAAGTFVISLDSMVNIAFPAMAAWFAEPPEAMRWVIMPYVFSYAVMSFVGGSLGDRIGHARVFRAGVAGSVLAFVVDSIAPAFGWLIAGRALQGIAGGLVYGTAPGILTLAARPDERGRALGVLNATIAGAFAAGPVVAGMLVYAFGWRAVFAARIPLALLALAWAHVALHDARGFVASRLVRPDEVLRVRVLGPTAVSFVANGGIFAVWLLAPFYLVEVRSLGTVAGGLVFMLTPLGTALAAPAAGRLADRIGATIPMVTGLVIEAAGLGLASRATETTPVVVVALALLAAGFGLGLFQVPNMAAVMAAFGTGQQGAAGGLSFMARTLGVVAGVATLSTVFAARRVVVGFEGAFATAFVIGAAAVAVAAVIAALLPVHRR
jgi:MFS family permease